MRLLLFVVLLLLAGCSGSSEPEQQATVERSERTPTEAPAGELVPGYTGGCSEGFIVYVQRQFSPYGTTIRRALDQKGESVGLSGNEELRAVGWTKTEHVFYPDNPEGLQGTVWYYVPELPNKHGAGWVPDVGLRAVRTEPAPRNDDKYFDPETQAAPQLTECELLAR